MIYAINYVSLFIISQIIDVRQCNTTVGGPQEHVPCIFPFRVNDTVYGGCTLDGNAPGAHTPWCSTRVDLEGVHIGGQGNWGVCGKQCLFDFKGDNTKL